MHASGTVLGYAQQAADRVAAQAQIALDTANQTWDSISLIAATAQVHDAIQRGDTEVLFSLSQTLGDFGLAVSDQAVEYGAWRPI